MINKEHKLDSLLIIAGNSNNLNFKLKIADSIFENFDPYSLDSLSKKRYITLGKIYQSANNYKCVTIYELLILDKSKAINYSEKIYLNFLLGNYYYNVTNYFKSYYYLNIAEKGFIKLKDYEYACFSIIFKSNILSFKKDFTGAEKLSIKSLKIAKKEKYNLIIYNSYITLGNSLTGLKNYNKAIEYYQKAFNVSKNLKSDPNYLSYKLQPLNYISIIYQNQKKYPQAIQSANNALNLIDNKSKEILLFCYLSNNLAYSKFKLGDKSSLKLFQETLKIGDSIKSIPIIITSKPIWANII